MSRLGAVLLFCGMVFLTLGMMSFAIFYGNQLPFTWVVLGVGLACLVAAVYKDMPFFVEIARHRTAKQGLNLGALVIIVLVLMVGVNFIGFRRDKKFDFTKEGLHTLSDQTKKILSSLDSDIEVRGFFAENQAEGAAAAKQKFKDLADLYSAVNTKVKVSFINPVKRPDLAKEYEVTTSGTISVSYKGKKAKFDDATEQGFTNALIKITRDKNKVFYFVTGHGEHSLDASDQSGVQKFKKYLTESSYEVRPLSFAEKQKVPDDADVVVVAGPKTAYFEPEIKALKDYLYRGGHLILALDPGTKTNLGQLTKELGVEFRNNYIVDQLGQLVGMGGATAVGINYSPTNEITRDFKQSMTVFHLASSLKTEKSKPDGFQVEEIVKSSPASFSKNELAAGAVRFVEGKDEKGPLAVVDTVTGKFKDEVGKGPAKEFQVVVAGDSDFLTDQLIDMQLNHDLILNAAAYLAKDKELVSIRPKTAENNQLTITKTQSTILGIGLLIIMPLGIFSLGGVAWYRRRTA